MNFDKPVVNSNHYASTEDKEQSDSKRRRPGGAAKYTEEQMQLRNALIGKISQRHQTQFFDREYYEQKPTYELNQLVLGQDAPQWDPRALAFRKPLSLRSYSQQNLTDPCFHYNQLPLSLKYQKGTTC